MEVKILDKGDNYLSCSFLTPRKYGTHTSQKCNISKDVLFEMSLKTMARCDGLMNPLNYSKNKIYIKFSQADYETNKICVKLQSKTLNLNKEYAVDDSEWRLIHEDTQNSKEVDLRFEIQPLFGKPLSFAPLYEDTALTDFELHGEDGSVQIHSAALAAFNPTLRRMLEGNWKQTQERALKIPQTSKATLQHLKDYIYLDVLPQSGVEDLLLLASLYMMDALKKKCTDKIIKTLKADKSFATLKFALDNNLTELFKAVLECVQSGSIKASDITP